MAQVKKSGLGRGLDSIFIENTAPSDGITMLRVSDIEPRSGQPRKNFVKEELEKLADSISQHGIIQPVAVSEAAGGFYEIIAGERRWRAAKMAGLSEIPVIILNADEKTTCELSLVENLQRSDLDPMEEAKAFNEMLEVYGFTQEGLSKSLGKSRSAVANTLRLLDLPANVQKMLSEKTLSAGHARALLALSDRNDTEQVAQLIISKDLSVRETEVLVKKINSMPEQTEEDNNNDNYNDEKIDYMGILEKKVSENLGRRIKISRNGKNRKIELYFEDDSDLENVISKLCGRKIFDDNL